MMAEAEAVEILVERAEPGVDAGAAIEGRSLADPTNHIEGRLLAAWRSEARRHLGLPDAPVFAAGHQAQAWHPGIVAKTFWTDARARQAQATAVHLVVDQDGFDGFFVEWPEMKDGFWTAKGHRFASASQEAAAMTVPAFQPREIGPCPDAPDSVQQGLKKLAQLLRSHAKAPNAPLQVSLAQLEGLSDWCAMPRVVSASQLTGTSFGVHLIDRMLKDPEACAAAFNSALERHPRAARPLRVQGAQSELPLWLLDESGGRVRATADGVRAARSSDKPLLPRAFLLGVLARTALADRFTHGLGGKVYEDVSDAWTRRWLGWKAPAFDCVSATLRLPLEIKELPRQKPFRAAWCDPDLAMVSGIGPSPRRKMFLDQIATLPRRSPQRRRLFESLVVDRQSRRIELASALTELQHSEQSLQQAKQSKELALRRSWCALLHTPGAIARLRDQLQARVEQSAG
ncbi:MAG: hypothetical protein K8R92_01305 [Planctomycetes bacterium]|nr:hypothetical protein [Planctomycetota bacterium]